MQKVFLAAVSVVLLLSMVVVPGCKKDSSSPSGPDPEAVTQLKANSSITPVSRTQVQGMVVVTDQSGNPVTGLTSSDFSAVLRYGEGLSKVTVDPIIGVVIVQTVSQSGKKVAVAATLDYSGSMSIGDLVGGKYRRIVDMESGVKTFVRSMNTGDMGEVIKFGSNVDFISPFTSDKPALLRAVDSSSNERGNTALYQSIYRGVQDAASLSATSFARAVVAFTDGGENNSSVTRGQLFKAARDKGIPVFTIGLIDSAYHSTPPGLYSGSEYDLVKIADTTGGFYFYAPSASQLAQIYTQVSGQLSNAMQMTVNWPSTGLPPSGTTVQAVITVTFNGFTTTFIKTYMMP